jgi:hypothetical protein
MTKAQCMRSGKYNVSDRINSQIAKDHIVTKVGKYATSNKGCFASQFRNTI